jgi:hypothetical protein
MVAAEVRVGKRERPGAGWERAGRRAEAISEG